MMLTTVTVTSLLWGETWWLLDGTCCKQCRGGCLLWGANATLWDFSLSFWTCTSVADYLFWFCSCKSNQSVWRVIFCTPELGRVKISVAIGLLRNNMTFYHEQLHMSSLDICRHCSVLWLSTAPLKCWEHCDDGVEQSAHEASCFHFPLFSYAHCCWDLWRP